MKVAQFRQTKLPQFREVYEKGKYGSAFCSHQQLMEVVQITINQADYAKAAWYLGLADKVAEDNANRSSRRRFRMRGVREGHTIRRTVPKGTN